MRAGGEFVVYLLSGVWDLTIHDNEGYRHHLIHGPVIHYYLINPSIVVLSHRG